MRVQKAEELWGPSSGTTPASPQILPHPLPPCKCLFPGDMPSALSLCSPPAGQVRGLRALGIPFTPPGGGTGRVSPRAPVRPWGRVGG